MRYGTGSAARVVRQRPPSEPPPLRRPQVSRREKPPVTASLGGYFVHHWRCAGHSLGYIARTPLASLMTIAVIGISLALPAGMYVLLKNVQDVSAGWDGSVQISLFLKKGVDGDAAQRLAGRVRRMTGVAAVDYISPAQALEEFRRNSGFGGALDALQSNPLPAVLIVHPGPDQSRPEAIKALVKRLGALEGVDLANLDMQWVERLYAIMGIVKRGIFIVAGLFGVGVLLIVGNTIRLVIQNRREEIQVKKLIGATDAFIRRPFLYFGCWYGLLGGLGAWLIVAAGMWLLQGPVQHLSLLYGETLRLHTLGATTAVMMVAVATVLGYLGAWLAVGRHLSAIEPT